VNPVEAVAQATAEQQARDLLERLEVVGAQSYSAGELVELANLIADANRFRALELREETRTNAMSSAGMTVDSKTGEVTHHSDIRYDRRWVSSWTSGSEG
jgi:hypothetical protein